MKDKPSDKEERYFLEQEVKRREALRSRYEAAAKELAARQATARAAGTADLTVADRLAGLGFSGESARAVDVLPLVLVAWADGSVSSRERAVVLEAARARGVAEGSEGWVALEALLEKPPAPQVADEILAVVRDLAHVDTGRAVSIVALCERVADATRSLFGMGARVSPEERALLETISQRFSASASAGVIEKL